MTVSDSMLWLIPLAPLAAAVLAGILALARRSQQAAPFITLLGTAVAGHFCFWSNPGTAPNPARHVSAVWLSLPPQLHLTLSVHVDQLAWVMLGVVCSVSVLVQVYSIGYMKGDPGYARYFAYIALFTASMLGLVVADNLFQLYVCWELVGICSYLLIGFWWRKPAAASAAKKAFVVTRFGDVGFMLGLLLLAAAAGSFDFAAVTSNVFYGWRRCCFFAARSGNRRSSRSTSGSRTRWRARPPSPRSSMPPRWLPQGSTWSPVSSRSSRSRGWRWIPSC
jgi:NADH-quinone oxidoreductase subunit L